MYLRGEQFKQCRSTFVVALSSKIGYKKTFKIIPQADGIERYEWKEVGMQELLELIEELDSILYGKSSQCQKCLEASIQDMFNRRSRDQSSGVVPALEDLPVDLLYLPKAYKDVFWRHSDGKGLITTVVDELDGKLLNPMRAAMVFSGGETGDIK
jgi:hypothetical protein